LTQPHRLTRTSQQQRQNQTLLPRTQINLNPAPPHPHRPKHAERERIVVTIGQRHELTPHVHQSPSTENMPRPLEDFLIMRANNACRHSM
ncbi:hypothetical protein, partial [Actinoplanes sp. NPDC048796]|uniref:hypothetical protein n=1 Tax=unclassified Actinoplanes TaxID=2626549 RepID=UPI0033DF7156